MTRAGNAPAAAHAGARTLQVVVAMLTYRRPDDLAVAVPALLAQAGTVPDEVRLLVVDNDPDGSARGLVEASGAHYVHEPRPGIAAARNAAMSAAADADVLVFIDDDERPVDRWLALLLDTYRDTGAPCVVGPVVSEFAAPPDAWVRAGRFFDRRRMPTGTPVTVAATNNLLLDVAMLRETGVRFDEAFGLSGGSDTLFSRTLVARGVRMVWCDEAVVVDVVPADRSTRSWVLHRARRSGNSASRCAVALASSPVGRSRARVRAVLEGSVRIAAGAARTAVGAVLRSPEHDARGRRTVARGTGMVSGAVGHVVYDYARA
ncbi:glycosyltransferase family 2 protein [Cellulomonas sp. URHB0016]